MAKVYQKVSDKEELLAAYRSGLLLLNTSDGRRGEFTWESCARWPIEDAMLDRFIRAHLGTSIWVPEDFAVLVDDDEDG